MSIKAFWDQRYAIDDHVYGTQPNDFLMAQLKHLTPACRVLCLAEGEGRNAVALARAGFMVTAVDISDVALRKAAALAERYQVDIEWVQADLSEFELGEQSWDAIVAIFMHLPPVLFTRVFHAIEPALTPGGVFIGEFYRPEQLRYGTGGPSDPAMLYSPEQLRCALYGLTPQVINAIERDIQEGTGHQGRSAVTQVVVNKPLSATGE